MEKIEIVNCPTNIESIEVESPIQHQNFLKTVKEKICYYKWEIMAGFIIFCVIVIVLCVFFKLKMMIE